MGGRPQAEIRGAVASLERARPTPGSGSGSEIPGLWRGGQGGPRVRRGRSDHFARSQGNQEARAPDRRFKNPPVWRRTQKSRARRTAPDGGFGLAGGAGNAGRPGVSPALDVQEPSRAGQAASSDGPCHLLRDSGGAPAPALASLEVKAASDVFYLGIFFFQPWLTLKILNNFFFTPIPEVFKSRR